MPVFARTRPRAGGLRRRCCSVPFTPATGRAASRAGRTAGSAHAIFSRLPSALVVRRSSRDRPEPSTMRTPVIGTPASASVCMTTVAPAALVPRSSSARPSCFSSISAVKLSLSRSMKRTIAASVGEETLASSSDHSSAGAVRTGPATATPAFRRASRKAVAAASAGVRVTTEPTRARSTTSAERGGDSSMKKLGFHPATIRRASYALSSPATPPVTLRMPRDFTCAASARRSARDKVGSPLPLRTSVPVHCVPSCAP